VEREARTNSMPEKINESSNSENRAASQLIRQAFIDRSAYKEGDVVGRQYRVHRVLGQGGYGVV
jgi:hypothetical protein